MDNAKFSFNLLIFAPVILTGCGFYSACLIPTSFRK